MEAWRDGLVAKPLLVNPPRAGDFMLREVPVTIQRGAEDRDNPLRTRAGRNSAGYSAPQRSPCGAICEHFGRVVVALL